MRIMILLAMLFACGKNTNTDETTNNKKATDNGMVISNTDKGTEAINKNTANKIGQGKAPKNVTVTKEAAPDGKNTTTTTTNTSENTNNTNNTEVTND